MLPLLIFAMLISHYQSFPHRYHQEAYPNQKWECHNCEGISKNIIFGFVRKAIATEYRDIYFNFDYSWMDKLLLKDKKVIVINIERISLFKFQENALNITAPSERHKEIYYIVISLGKNKEKLSFTPANEIDSFLFNNPCWIPIHDPPVVKLVAKQNFQDGFNKRMSDQLVHNYNNSDYYRSAIFVRLPYFTFGATCSFYTYLSR